MEQEPKPEKIIEITAKEFVRNHFEFDAHSEEWATYRVKGKVILFLDSTRVFSSLGNETKLLSDYIFEDEVLITQLHKNYDGRLMFENCLFKSRLADLSEKGVIHLYNCEFKGNLKISSSRSYKNHKEEPNNEKAKQVRIFESKSSGEISFSGYNFGYIDIIGGCHENLNIKGIFKSLYISPELRVIEKEEQKPHINKLKIDLYDGLNLEEVKISNAIIQDLELCRLTNNGTFICRDSTINNLTFNDFTNEKDFKLLNIKSENTDGKLIIKDSYLGKMYWSSVDFSSWKHAQVFNSTLIDLILTNVKLPKKFIGKTETDFEGIKEAYRQLKYVFSKQGDLVEELKHKQLEMQAFSKTVLNRGDKTILWLNRWSNNFGQDWRNAGSGMLIVSLIGFTTIKYLLGEPNFCWDNVPIDVVAFLKLMINPLHYDMKSVFSKECAGANLIYVSTKLLNLFFSVQLVLAFRKFAKS